MLNKDTFFMPEIVETGLIRLERRRHCYDKALSQLIEHSRDHLRKFLFWVDHIQSLEDTIKATDKFLADWDCKEVFDYLVFDKADNLVGAGGLHDISYEHQSADFGYLLDVDQTGKGYASDLVKTIEKLAFDGGFHRLQIVVDVLNLSSQKVAKRCGYDYEGTKKDCSLVYDGYRSNMIFAKINSEKAL